MKTIRTIGIIGGGQLGRMLTQAATTLGFKVIVLETNANCPAAQVGADVITGNLYDAKAIKKLAAKSDVVTIEIEHLNTDALLQVTKSGTPVYPAPETVAIIQDKYKQKKMLLRNGIAVAKFSEIKNLSAAQDALKKFNGQLILKAKHGAYDGRGNAVVKSQRKLQEAIKMLGERELYAEELLDFEKELSVIIARDIHGNIETYDVVEMKHARNICLEVLAPAQISTTAYNAAEQLAHKTAEHLKGAGVFAIEMFLLKDGRVFVNEIAPRVHNSGHHTIEACITSQFEQHIRAITGLPLGVTSLVSPAAMVNILGTYDGDIHFNFKKALAQKNVHCHWYGKAPIKVDRKMGHITALSGTVKAAQLKARKARKVVTV